jgi:general secretion pathway protein A
MYESFYGFKEKPFNLTPDPDYLYMSKAHESAYTHLEYAITENKGFVVITGEIGSGKTTLINYLLSKIQQSFNVGIINYTPVFPTQFMKMICQEFDLKTGSIDKARMLDVFYQFLLEQFAEKRRVLLIIDEAQKLPARTIEEIRMLSNLEAEKHHLLQIILVGQPELRVQLQKKGLEQLAQRVTVYGHIEGLKGNEVAHYIRHRLRVAGANNLDIFEKEAIEVIHKYSRGIPRVINILCDAALVYGYADEAKTIGRNVVQELIRTREIGGLPSVKEDDRTVVSPSPKQSGVSLDPRKQFHSLDRRVTLLESAVAGIDQRLNALAGKKEERDRIVIDLFKMLRQSMESRRAIFLKYKELKERMEIDNMKRSRFPFFREKKN